VTLPKPDASQRELGLAPVMAWLRTLHGPLKLQIYEAMNAVSAVSGVLGRKFRGDALWVAKGPEVPPIGGPLALVFGPIPYLATTLQNSFTIVIPLHISGLRVPQNISPSRHIAAHMQEIPRWN